MTRDDAQTRGIPNLWLLVEQLTIRTGCETELNRQADLAQRELAALVSGSPASPDQHERIAVLERAIGNCYMMAKREIARLWKHDGDESSLAKTLERWQHVQRFCETTGSKSSILRGQLPTEPTEGSPASPSGAVDAGSGVSAPQEMDLHKIVGAIPMSAIHDFYWDVDRIWRSAPHSMQYNARDLAIRDGIIKLLGAAPPAWDAPLKGDG